MRSVERSSDGGMESGKYACASTLAEANLRAGVKDVTEMAPAGRERGCSVIFRAGHSCQNELAAVVIT